jgi:hypothetical protein
MATKMIMGGGGSLTNGKGTLKIARNEYIILGLLLPYLAMVLGMVLALVFAFVMRVYMYWFGSEGVLSDTFIATGIILISAGVLCWCAWRFFGQRKAIDIKEHATLTTGLAHVWMLFAMWSNLGSWVWHGWVLVVWTFGCVIIGLSWCMRRWAQNGDDSVAGRDDNTKSTLDKIGLGESYWRGKPILDGEIGTAELQLDHGYTVADAKRKRDELAGVAGLPTSQVHVSDVEGGRADRATVTFVKEDPFKRRVPWVPELYVGTSISDRIEFGTYQDASRAGVALAGHNGGSLQHFQVMGMSGVGKSKVMQAIYGKAVACADVNIIFGDPIKGLQTGEPLAEGLAIFADTMAACERLIDRLNHVITVRTNYLTSKGLSHWMPGCGIKFEIFHLEEFARFHKNAKLVELTEAARSAGIMFVFSLQRASSTRQKTDIRFNLGGSMCFGVHDAVDARFALSEYTLNAGAQPHHWQDRYPGRFYFEAHGVDARKFAMPIQSDWVDIDELRRAVNGYGDEARCMDRISADAWGDLYSGYQTSYSAGSHAWQRMRQGQSVVDESGSVDSRPDSGDSGTVARPDGHDGSRSSVSKVDAERVVWLWLRAQHEAGIEVVSFADIKAATLVDAQRSESWLNSYLTMCIVCGALRKHERRGHYYTPERAPE